jgi:RES domain-containing protein
MAKRRSKRLPERVQIAPPSEGEMPSLLELDRFSETSIRQWQHRAAALSGIYSSLYFDLEPLRQRDGQRLLDAIRKCAVQDYRFKNWSRIVDYQFSLQPLSNLGSLKDIGGRFNIGQQIAPGTISGFPALYIAEDYSTAFRERFGLDPDVMKNKLGATEIALRRIESFTQVRLHGNLDWVVDISDPEALRPFVEIIRLFPIPKMAVSIARQMGMKRPPWLIRSVSTLQRNLLHPNWRAMPMQFSVPANSQVFGRIASAAGLHGILYPSTKSSDKRCLALFPQNWKSSTSFLEITDAPPSSTIETRLDGGDCVAN